MGARQNCSTEQTLRHWWARTPCAVAAILLGAAPEVISAIMHYQVDINLLCISTHITFDKWPQNMVANKSLDCKQLHGYFDCEKLKMSMAEPVQGNAIGSEIHNPPLPPI